MGVVRRRFAGWKPANRAGWKPALRVVVAILVTVELHAAALPQRNVDRGIAVELSSSALRAGESADFTFDVRDTTSGAPVTGVRPAGWLALQKSGRTRSCAQSVARFLSGDLFGRAAVDLNSYYVLSLNDDASISVVDPLFSFGGSKLLALLTLEARGDDWALSSDQSTLFVSMPEAGKVAIADTNRWSVTRNIAVGPNPRRLALGESLWVAHDEGLTAIDPLTFETTRIPLRRAHDLVLSGDGSRLFVATDGGVAIVDAHARRLLRGVEIDGRATMLAWSPAAAAAYAGDPRSGRIFAIDSDRGLTGTIETKPGLSQIRFAPNGRHALVANPEANLIQVIDAATNRVVQNGAIDGAPDHVAFTDLLAYVRRRDSEIVLMITLDQIGVEGKPLSVADFPGGQHPFGAGPQSLADTIVSAPEAPSVLVANGRDRMIYLYKEGMAAPAGGFSTYARQPRAVLVVDRGLRESLPGRYATRVPIAAAGEYDVVFFLNAPRVVTCFPVAVAPREGELKRTKAQISAIRAPKHLVAGERTTLRFALTDAAGRERLHASDVRALAFEAPGVWQQRGDVQRSRDGDYTFAFTPPEPGLYYVWLESESLGLTPNHEQFFVFEAK